MIRSIGKISTQLRLHPWVPLLVLLSCFSRAVVALPTAALSNFNQPSSGGFQTIRSLSLLASPFVTDSRFTQFDAAEINAVTLRSPGNVFVQIWDVNPANAEPGNVIATLNGPPEPSGVTQYTGTVNLLPNTSYFLVIRTGNNTSTDGTAVFVAGGNQADSQPPPIYQLGTDTDGDGTINVANRCIGTVVNATTVGWSCAGGLSRRFMPKFRIFAEEPVPTMPPAPPSLTSNPLFLDFGTVTSGVTSAPVTATIENNGGVDQVLGNLSLAAGASFALSSDACSGTTLMPGATCVIGLTFTPPSGGQFSDTVIIPASTDPTSPYGLQLVGEGGAPPLVQSLTTNPAGLDFGAVDQGTTAPERVIQVENNGTANQILGTLTVAAPFAIATDACSGMTLLPTDTCDVGITFAPSATGIASGALQVPATGDTKSPYSVPLAGEGNPLPSYNYSLTSTPLSLDFGVVADGSTSAPETAVIQNDGNVAQLLGTVSVGTGFTLATDNCSGSALSPGSTCSISITFSPTHGGVNTGTALIPAVNDPRSPYGLGLAGESSEPGIALPPSGSIAPKPVPLRFTLLTALAVLGIVAIRQRRLRKAIK